MPLITQVLRARQRRKKKYDHKLLRRSGLGCATALSLIAAILFVGVTIIYAALTVDIPSHENLIVLLEPPDGLLLQPTRFYDKTGQHILLELENPAIETRQYLSLSGASTDEKLPDTLIHATIAHTDPTFWEHPGFISINLKPEDKNSLAQQIVSNLLIWNETPGIRREFRERLLAAQITRLYGREKILEWYLNSAYYGNQIYGAAAAAQAYFGKSASELTLSETAILTAVAETPTINPIDAPDTTLERGQMVIESMASQGWISTSEAAKARKDQVIFAPPVSEEERIAPAFVSLVWEHLAPSIPLHRLERGGFNIITTLDYNLQAQALCTSQIHIAQLGDQAVSTDTCEAARLLSTLSLGNEAPFSGLNANVIVMDPLSGEILALVGETTPGLDPAHLPGHPPGSLLSPFVYLTAFTRGFNPASLLWDIPSTFSEEISQATNPDGDYLGPVRLREALANDYRIPALATMNQIGAETVWRTLEQFGISSLTELPQHTVIPECPSCLFLLEGGQVSLLEMTQAYGIFANQGNLAGQAVANAESTAIEPIAILQVYDAHGREWQTGQLPSSQPVTSAQLAYLMNHMLSDESARWQSLGHPNPLEIGRPAAAKIGHTTQGNDIWTIGYTPQLIVSVWIGQGTADSLEAGALPEKIAASLWHALIQYAARDLPIAVWDAPPGIRTLTVCDPSGMLPTDDCPSVVSDVFLSGHEPTQADNLFRSYQINRETGRLATVFTPPELIEEQIFMLVPPEASQWAIQAELPTPPESYDIIHMPSPSPDAEIISPEIFSNLSGEVTIRGTAGGEDFESYRLQIGNGLNPQNWLAISDVNTNPVTENTLATWDTAGIDGLYAVQLIVIRSDQRIDTHTIQVTIDNTPPEVAIAYPVAGQIFDYQATVPITFQVQVTDNLGLATIDYLLDGHLIESQTQPPFALPWLPRLGEHTLTIHAVDLSGNESSISVTFSIEN